MLSSIRQFLIIRPGLRSLDELTSVLSLATMLDTASTRAINCREASSVCGTVDNCQVALDNFRPFRIPSQTNAENSGHRIWCNTFAATIKVARNSH